MKRFLSFFLSLTFLLSACGLVTPTATPATPIIVEVTRIIQITTTPAPSQTSTPSPTLNPVEAGSTLVAERVGTPIVADLKCFETAISQSDLNSCAAARRDELEQQMTGLVDTVVHDMKNSYYYSNTDIQTFLQFQAEWNDFIQRECAFTSGYAMDNDGGRYKGGSMAPMNYNECLVGKYEDRLRELKGLLFSMHDG